ncbi:phage portal protein [Embleya sp. NPDC127516]|uniref:phage portal protein n=1 Tax=Embleya sp. NPDC127516 TaxID=3363990 RepID=UPI0037F53CAA
MWTRRPDRDRARAGPRPVRSTVDEILATFRGLNNSYTDVDLSSAEGPLQAVAVWSACDLVASLVSELPVDLYRGAGAERRQLPMPSYLLDPDGSGHGLADWSYRVVMSWLLRGNTYGAVLDRGAGGFLRQVDLFHPDRVRPTRVDGSVAWTADGAPVPDAQMLHRRVNPMPGCLLGLSPVQLHMTTIGQQVTAGRFGLQWFQDGAHPSALLINTETALDADQAATAKERFLAAVRGRREPLVMGKGWDYRPLQVSAEESQFLQTQGYSAAECARIFGPGIAEVLGYGSGSMTYANIVDRDLHLLKYAVGKWIRRLERLLFEFLPRPQYVRLNRDALLETNTAQRYAAYGSSLTAAWQTINEVRAIEDRPPVPWGDAPYVPAAATGPAPDESDDPPPTDVDPTQEE